MADVDTSIYHLTPNDPLKQVGSVVGIANVLQQNQLLQTATQQRQLELNQGFTNDLMNNLAPLVNSPNLTQAQARAENADRARQINASGTPAFNVIDQQLSGPDWQTNLKNMAIRATGPANILTRQGTISPQTGAQTSLPATSQIGQPVQTSIGTGQEASAAAYFRDTNTAGQLQTNLVPWNKAYSILNELPEGSTGPTAPMVQRLNEFVWGLSPTLARWSGVDPKNMQDWGQLQKYLVSGTQQQANRVGGAGSDFQLATAITGNPHASINDLTNKQVVAMNIAVQKAEAAQTLAAGKKGGPLGYLDQRALMARNLDIRAFLAPDQLQKLKLTPAERANFNRSYDIGVKAGILDNPIASKANGP